MNQSKAVHESGLRRHLLLAISLLLLLGSFGAWWFGQEAGSKFASAAMGRIGLVLAALWLAWPSLQRPASWFPPIVPVIGLIALVVLAAQPRLMVMVLPAVGILVALSVLMKGIRNS